MTEKEIFEQFLSVSEISKDDVVDYRFCTKLYAGMNIPNSIIIQLKDKHEYRHIIYTAYDVKAMVDELRKSMGKRTGFEQGYHAALDDVDSYGREVEHVTVH